MLSGEALACRDIYVNEVWHDEALRYDFLSPCKSNMTLNSDILLKIWTPGQRPRPLCATSPRGRGTAGTAFINSKSAHIHKSPFTNVFFMIYQVMMPASWLMLAFGGGMLCDCRMALCGSTTGWHPIHNHYEYEWGIAGCR